jgi:hypothetical protein
VWFKAVEPHSAFSNVNCYLLVWLKGVEPHAALSVTCSSGWE